MGHTLIVVGERYVNIFHIFIGNIFLLFFMDFMEGNYCESGDLLARPELQELWIANRQHNKNIDYRLNCVGGLC